MSRDVVFEERLLVEEVKRLPLDKKIEVFEFVKFLGSKEEEKVKTVKLSEPSFARIWDNEEDAVYDNL